MHKLSHSLTKPNINLSYKLVKKGNLKIQIPNYINTILALSIQITNNNHHLSRKMLIWEL